MLGLSGCNDDDSYPGCDSTWWCDFNVSSWNQGSTNYWIYGANEAAYFYYDGSLLGTEYVTVPRNVAGSCATFDALDVLTWDGCVPDLDFTCDFVKRAKEVYATRSSATAGLSGRYTPGPANALDFDCTR